MGATSATPARSSGEPWSPRTLVVVQARLGSSRLPGKVLKTVAGAPVLARMLERVRAARTPFELVVATTTAPEDERIEDFCVDAGVACVRGHPRDLLDRHLGAARAFAADVVVKIPSDCPLVDPGVIDRVLGAFLAVPGRFDYVSNLHPATYPDGNDVEVMTRAALEQAAREARRPFEREHTTPFLWDQPGRFRIGNVVSESGRDLSMSHRFTLDYPEDLAFVTAVYSALWRPERPIFGLDEILALLEAQPSLRLVNARYAGVNWYRDHLHELLTVKPNETRAPTP
jgi:spore coat polysaccharide biosynthesis protein SpsF